MIESDTGNCERAHYLNCTYSETKEFKECFGGVQEHPSRVQCVLGTAKNSIESADDSVGNQ
ncbi:hypothetical protein KY284_026699 [Solanum tuberosum]|nr:hypothetical protein KY284_026699 [Solanum tuberosum]